MNTDLIGRFCELLKESLSTYEGGAEEAFALQIERQLRNEYGGDRVRINKCELRGDALRDEIRRRWNGRNADEIAADMGIHRATVYRALRYRPLS